MIAFIIGTVVDMEENKVTLEHHGMGFNIYVPASVVSRISIEDKVKLYTFMSVKEDDISLYGFLSKDDLQMYRMLLNVNGIGPKAALGILSALTADELRFAILADDVTSIAKAPGIGKKTAQKLILELKDKLNLDDAFEKKLEHQNNSEVKVTHGRTDAASEAVQALVALGYSATDALRVVKHIDHIQDMSVEEILKAALKHF